jgi:cytochrome c oxidase subunit 3
LQANQTSFPQGAAHQTVSHELRHHFADMEQQRETASFGMWIFLITEIMFFGGLFCSYLIYRFLYPTAFLEGSAHMSLWIGATNTAVLICSSLTMVLAVHSAKVNRRQALIMFLLFTMLLGMVFLGLKGVEYHEHWVRGEFPGPAFHFEGTDPRHVEIFFVLYFVMTGLHALHMVIGCGMVLFLIYHAYRGQYNSEYYNPVEMGGLYWHFVDIVWIFLFPLLYLISHHHV